MCFAKYNKSSMENTLKGKNMGIIRDSFVIFSNWAEAINTLPDEYQLETYKALMEYGMSGKIPDNLSAICKAMLVSFSVGMENSICRYNASIENGKKGGAPKGNQNARKKEKESEEDNEKQPKTTQNNLEQPKTSENNLNVNDNDNVNVNDNKISEFNKEINNVFDNKRTHTHENKERVSIKTDKEREEYLVMFDDAFAFLSGKFRDAGLEIIDTLIEARRVACTFEGLKFNHKSIGKISFDDMVKHLSSEKIIEIAGQLALNEEIKNRPYYILGCLVKSYDEYLADKRKNIGV